MIPETAKYSYNYSYMHPLEAQVDYTYAMKRKEWMSSNWTHSITISCLYLLGIYYGQIYMRNRKAMNLRGTLIGWNIFLSIFSIVGFIRFSPAFLYSLWTHGFLHTICVTDYHLGVTGFWTEVFAASKVIELGDTVFLVLRKRPVIFLHYYHHVTVLIFTWYIFKEMAACGRWFVGMNYAVHAVMYPYYAVRAVGYKTPKWISMVVTTLQLAQMVFGVVVTLGILRTKLLGIPISIPDGTNNQQACQLSDRGLAFSVVIYFTYFCLFVQFFSKAYFKSSMKSSFPPSSIKTAGSEDYSNKARQQNGTILSEIKGENEAINEIDKTFEYLNQYISNEHINGTRKRHL